MSSPGIRVAQSRRPPHKSTILRTRITYPTRDGGRKDYIVGAGAECALHGKRRTVLRPLSTRRVAKQANTFRKVVLLG